MKKNRSYTSILLIAFSFLVSGCYTENYDDKTAMGSAAGGVIGASLGAIVGSQTGDPGTGLVLGGLAGTAAGAGVGNYADYQDENYERGQERMSKHDQMIQANRRELDQIRKMNGDFKTSSLKDRIIANRALPSSSSSLRNNYSNSYTGRNFDANARTAYPSARLDQNIDRQDRTNSQNFARQPSSFDNLQTQKQKIIRSNEISSETSDMKARYAPGLLADKKVAHDERDRLDADQSGLREKDLKIESNNLSANRLNNNNLQDEGYGKDDINQEKKPSSIFAPIKSKPLILEDSESTAESKKEDRLPAKSAFDNQPKNNESSLGAESDIDPDVARLMNGGKEVRKVENPIEETTDNENKLIVSKLAGNPSEKSLDSDCMQAEDEMNKAATTAENADKLFHYRRALRLCPNDPSYHNVLGELYLKLKRKSDAQYEFNEALTIDSNYQPAKENLSNLK